MRAFSLLSDCLLAEINLDRNKAVSDGSVSFYLDHFVRYRVAKVTYGSRGRRRYDPADPNYTKRMQRLFVDPNGVKWITHGFDSILLRVRILLWTA